MNSGDIWLIVGTRPEAIKLAPVARALAAAGNRPHLVLSGQHPDLDPAKFNLGDYAASQLGCPGQANPHAHVQAVKRALLPRLMSAARPQLIVVQGDTSTAMGGALAAFAAGVALAHVEAGLRTHDPAMPWPEEDYRVAIDSGADLLLAPTALAAANLADEQVPGTIHVTGNTAVDAVLDVLAALPPRPRHPRRIPLALVTCHRRENWNAGLDRVAAAVIELASEQTARFEVLLHPNPFVSGRIRQLLGSRAGIRLVEPCGHRQLIARMRDADLLLSDSGGVQEEAPTIGVPLLILREKTERPEAIATGNMQLVGTEPGTIVEAVRRVLGDADLRAAMSSPCMPYGDGQAGPRIAAILGHWIAQRSRRIEQEAAEPAFRRAG